MTSLKTKLRKVKYGYAHSVWLALSEYYFFKNRNNYDFILNDKYFYITSAFHRASKEMIEYEKWKEEYNSIRKTEMKINRYYSYLGLKNRKRYG